MLFFVGAVAVISLVGAIPTLGLTLLIAIPVGIFFFTMLKSTTVRSDWTYSTGGIGCRSRYYVSCNWTCTLSRPLTCSWTLTTTWNFPNTNRHRDGGMFSVVKSAKYEQDWLQFKGELVDGTIFRLRITSDIKRKSKTKRKSTKITETFREKYTLTVVPPPERFQVNPQFEMAVQQQFANSLLRQHATTMKVKSGTERVVLQTVTKAQQTGSFLTLQKNHLFRPLMEISRLELFKLAYTGASILQFFRWTCLMYNLDETFATANSVALLQRQINGQAPATLLRSIKVKIISNCNLRCEMCRYWQITKQQLDEPTVLSLLDHAAALGARKVHFSGGEVTLHPALNSFIEHASRLGMRVNLTSNGIAMNKQRGPGLDCGGLASRKLLPGRGQPENA